jgi:urease accessory protein
MNPTPVCARPAAAAALWFVLPAAYGQGLLAPTGVPWIDGTLHPMEEVNHLVALLGIGVVAALFGRACRLGLSLLAALLMLVGLVLGGQGALAPAADTMVMTTLLACVLLIMAKVRLTLALAASIIGAFALFHGVTEGGAMRIAKPGADYLIGYALANVAAWMVSLLAGEWIRRQASSWSEHHRHFVEWLHGHGLRHG